MLAFAVLKADLTLPLISLHASLSCLLQILLPGFSICAAMFYSTCDILTKLIYFADILVIAW